jgi:AraC-like DNA-binding protein
MITIEHSYGADLSWVDHLAKQFGAKIEGNFIIVPEEIQSGTRYFLECEEGIVAYYLNIEYNKNIELIQNNHSNDFIGFYYNLTEGEASVSKNDLIYPVGRWEYNLSVIDSSLKSKYIVKAGSKTFALCIFIKKNVIKSLALKNNITIPNIDEITDPKKNTVIRFDRMSNESYHLLNDLRKLEVGGAIFNLNLIGTVHMLISNYLKKISTDRIVIQTVNEADLASIIKTQQFLIDHIRDHFPSIKFMASEAYMSESKFKNLFKKITGITPNSFFMNNKLLLAKELLEKKQLSISQISDELNFASNSYFSSCFKEYFGLSPKEFIKQL